LNRSAVVLSFFLLCLMCGCSKDNPVDQKNTPIGDEVIYATGRGTVVGWQGYFSPETSPLGYPQPLPPGYAMSGFTWEQGAPTDSSYWMLYLRGRESDLAKAHRVRATGNWEAIQRIVGTSSAKYISLSIDSLEVLE
jgi:hypothetical protein